MTRVLLASLVIFMVGCGKTGPVSSEDSGADDEIKSSVKAHTPPPQESLRPTASWQSPSSGIPKISELSLGRKPDSPWTFRPYNDVPDWNFSLPLDWAADPFEDLNWQHHLHSWRSMEYWLHDHRRDADPAHLLVPIKIALDWHRFHIEQGLTSALQWDDHATGIRASRLGFLLEFILSDRIELSDDDLTRLMTLADLHAEMLMDPDFLKPNNHGLFQLVGLDALCSVVGWRESCQGARTYAKEAFAKLVQRWYSEEGVNVENSPTYHEWVTRQIRKLEAVERFQQPNVQETLERAEIISPWLTYPDGRWVRVGDSYGDGPKLTGPVEPECLPEGGDCWAVLDLTKSGYAIIRSLPEVDESDSSMLFVSGTTAPTGHKHADDLGFVFVEGGQDIFVDSGMYGYNYDEERSYVRSARGHNVLSFESRRTDPYVIEPANSSLGPIVVEQDRFTIKGVVDRPGLFIHERTLSYVPGVLLQIEDKLNNLTDLRWQSNLHLAPDLIPEINDGGFVVRVGDDLTVHAEFSGEGCEMSAVRGETDPYQGWVSVGYLELTPATVVVASCPADLVESSWYITFER